MNNDKMITFTKIPNTGEVADWWTTEGVIEMNFGRN